MSAAKTTPPAVGVTPARMGRGASNFQRTLPFSASNAVTQPLAFATGVCVSVFSLPSQVPAVGNVVVSRLSLTRIHQSTAPTYRELVCGLYAAPFHSDPPWLPGQKGVVVSRDSTTSVFMRVVVGVWERRGSVDPTSPALLAPLPVRRDRSTIDK